jgi:DEAD/DEAH box helicase domain-containing protein
VEGADSSPSGGGGDAVGGRRGEAEGIARHGSWEAALQGMAHALRHVAALRLMCDPHDLGAVAEVRSTHTRLPTVTVYEAYPGGVGYAHRLFELHDQLLASAADLVAECPCAAGCPSCIGPLHLVTGAKDACLRLLRAQALTYSASA